MRRAWKGLILLGFIFLSTPLAEAQFSGRDLVDGWNAYQRASSKSSGKRTDQIQAADYMGFILGVWNSASYYNPTFHVVAKGITLRELCHVVGKYLDKHPERWNEAAVILAVDAIHQEFPTFPRREKTELIH